MKYFISLLLLVTFISCNDEDDMSNLGQTENDIIEYIESNNINATRTSNGAYYVIDEVGNGIKPATEGYVTVIYTGYFLDGSEFDMSDTDGALFDLLNVIPGFAEGIVHFDEGAKGTIYIPPSLAYGDSGVSGVIPQNAVLIFDIEVVKVTNPQTEDDIIAYLDENNLQAERSDTGLYYIIEEEGSGDVITENSIVTIVYEGTLLDGTIFDSSGDDGVEFDLRNVIPGFSEGATYFKRGGKGTLYIPPSLAYGENGVQNRIPRNSVLIFDIDIK